MYSPAHYIESDLNKITEFVAKYNFATLLGPDGSVSHVPLLLEKTESGYELLGHMARANPQWRELETAGWARAIFHGPHSYISPAWYSPNPSNVPTWSYAVVHVGAEFNLVEGNDAMLAMDQMTNHFEGLYGTGWSLPQDRSAVERLLNAIVVFRLKNLAFSGKFKLNQMQSAEERCNVVEGLKRIGDHNAEALANLISTGITE